MLPPGVIELSRHGPLPRDTGAVSMAPVTTKGPGQSPKSMLVPEGYAATGAVWTWVACVPIAPWYVWIGLKPMAMSGSMVLLQLGSVMVSMAWLF